MRGVFTCLTLAFALGCGGGNAPPADAELPIGGVPSLAMGDARLELVFEHHFGADPLELGAVNETASGLPVQVDTLRYWVSNIALLDGEGGVYRAPSAYYLVEQTAAKTRTSVVLEGVPAGVFDTIRFGIGVDAAHNHSLDLFEGELSTAVQMHWDWQSGFVFLKVEGLSGAGDAQARYLVHVGNDAAYQVVRVPLGARAFDDDSRTVVRVKVDVAPVFDGLDVSTTKEVIGGPEGSPAVEALERFATRISLVAE